MVRKGLFLTTIIGIGGAMPCVACERAVAPPPAAVEQPAPDPASSARDFVPPTGDIAQAEPVQSETPMPQGTNGYRYEPTPSSPSSTKLEGGPDEEKPLPTCEPLGDNAPQAIAIWRNAVRAERRGEIGVAVQLYEKIINEYPDTKCDYFYEGSYGIPIIASDRLFHLRCVQERGGKDYTYPSKEELAKKIVNTILKYPNIKKPGAEGVEELAHYISCTWAIHGWEPPGYLQPMRAAEYVWGTAYARDWAAYSVDDSRFPNDVLIPSKTGKGPLRLLFRKSDDGWMWRGIGYGTEMDIQVGDLTP